MQIEKSGPSGGARMKRGVDGVRLRTVGMGAGRNSISPSLLAGTSGADLARGLGTCLPLHFDIVGQAVGDSLDGRAILPISWDRVN